MKTKISPFRAITEVEVQAPASVSNVAVGFDCLGYAISGWSDRVILKLKEPSGSFKLSIKCNFDLPTEVEKNTAGQALKSLMADKGGTWEMEIKKGIPLSSGLGGSAASAVAAVVAGNAFLKKPISKEELVERALEGELIASKSRHADNVVPCLLGGFQLILGNRYFSLPMPKEIYSVVVYPDLQVETKVARAILRSDVSLEVYIRNSARIAVLMLALHQKNSETTEELFRDILIDEAIEPQRQALIKGFQEVKTAAIASRALGFSISGAGPSVFGWALSEKEAKKTAKAVKETWSRLGVSSVVWVGQLSKNAAGAKVIREK